jgi:glycosyltransferase involved in cell wall biosynthesis
MSIVLVVGNQRQRAERTLQTLLVQEGIEGVEIILIDAGPPGGPALAGAHHPSIRRFLQERGPPYGEMRARGARLARGAWVAFIEEHCHALEGWLAAAQSAAAGPWDAVGGEMHSANPGVGISDAIAMMNYGTWTPPASGGESSLLPGHNALYRREVLLAYGRRLGWFLQAEAVFHPRLIRDGYRIGIDPAMKFGHLNETDLAVICRSYLHWHRAFGGFRAEEGGWGRGHRLLRAASTPLVPFVRAGRLFVSCLRGRRQDLRPFLLNLPVILVAQGSAAIGLGLGYLFGPGTSAAAFVDSELDAERRSNVSEQAA